MADIQVRVLPEAEEFLDSLPDVLFREGYKMNLEYAEKYVDDILSFISDLPHIQHYTLLPEFAYHFARYGTNLHYAFFKRNSSSKTTWYVFFECKGDFILVKHITNNWLEGHYIR